MHQPFCNQLLVLDLLCIQADIDKLHFDFLLCKWHFLRMPIRRTHCNMCESIGCTIALAGNRYCKRMVRFDIRPSYYMDLRSMVRLDIDIWQCDCSIHKLLADRSLHPRKLDGIPNFRFVHSFYIFPFRSIQRSLHIDYVASSDIRFDLLDYHNIRANIDIH